MDFSQGQEINTLTTSGNLQKPAWLHSTKPRFIHALLNCTAKVSPVALHKGEVCASSLLEKSPLSALVALALDGGWDQTSFMRRHLGGRALVRSHLSPAKATRISTCSIDKCARYSACTNTSKPCDLLWPRQHVNEGSICHSANTRQKNSAATELDTMTNSKDLVKSVHSRS